MMESITRPTLLINRARVVRNIRRMAARCAAAGVRLRPHFKTHHSAEVGEWFRAEGIDAITVSSIDMAAYFARAGWDDITIAFPLNIRQIDKVVLLAEETKLSLLVESPPVLQHLQKFIQGEVTVWIKIDSGAGRTGIHWQDQAAVLSLARMTDGHRYTRFGGLLTHAGHTYHGRSPAEIVDIYSTSVRRMQSVRDELGTCGFPGAAISVGDTPGCSLAPDLGGVTEVRPGNFVFYDLMQLALGSCSEEEIAVALACPVVALHPERATVVCHGGAVHLSKEQIRGPGGIPHYGRVALPADEGWGPLEEGMEVVSISQEHGIVSCPERIGEIREGDLLCIIPVHSCLTAHLMQANYAVLGLSA